MDSTGIIQLVASLLLGGGFLGGVALLLKVRPEASDSNVTTAGKANAIVLNVLTDLEKRYNLLDQRYEELEREYKNLELAFEAVRAERDQFATELIILRNKLSTVEGVSAT